MKKTNEQYRENMKKLMTRIMSVGYDDIIDISETMKKLTVLLVVHNNQEEIVKELFSDLNAVLEECLCDQMFLVIFAREVIGYVGYCKHEEKLSVYLLDEFCQKPVIDDVVSKLQCEYKITAPKIDILGDQKKH